MSQVSAQVVIVKATLSICQSSDCEGNAEYVDIVGLSSASSFAAYVLKTQPNGSLFFRALAMSPMGRVPLLPCASTQEIRSSLSVSFR